LRDLAVNEAFDEHAAAALIDRCMMSSAVTIAGAIARDIR
jgi:hypothetical protein